MTTVEKIEKYFGEQKARGNGTVLKQIEQHALDVFSKQGIPTTRHEEWKYTPVHTLFHHDFLFGQVVRNDRVTKKDVDTIRLPGSEQANELVFVNGFYSETLSAIRSPDLKIYTLDEAMQNGYAQVLTDYLGSGSKYVKDGVYALNTAFVQQGNFILPGTHDTEPIYIYHIIDAGTENILALPRHFIYVRTNCALQIVETYTTLGALQSFCNEVMEIVMEADSNVEYYKIQDDVPNANSVSTTYFRQIGRSVMHAVTISLNAGLVRNNLNIGMDAEYAEAHLYGLYYLRGKTHVDNHTVVDNIQPNCLSNELYKGIIDDEATAVFNGKIFVQKDAQKTNAFQSNKNVLLSKNATVNTKPQLEIFADDVKCSHGCTVGQLDDEGLFYLRSRGISEKVAKSLLIHGYAMDILEKIKPAAIREHVDRIISHRLEYDIT